MTGQYGRSALIDNTATTLLALLLLAFLAILPSRIALSRKRLPPGPSLLTRILDFSKGEPLSKRFMRWNKEYGSVVSVMDFTHLGKPTIVLGTPKAALDLLEKRGYAYSSRPRNIICGEICYRDSRATLLQICPKQRKFRALMNSTVGTEPSKGFRALEIIESKLLLRDLLLEKDDAKYHSHLRRAVYSVAFCVTYGRRVSSLDADHVQLHGFMEKFFLRNFVPGNYLVDHFPLLLHLPRCLQWFRKEAERQAHIEHEFFLSLLNQARSTVVSEGPIPLCAAVRVSQKQQELGLSDVELAIMTSSPYTAGVFTTLGELEALILAMTLFPDVMRAAQKEIDSVVGSHRMPDFRDFGLLPYMRATVKEALRWHPAIPFGIPHAVIRDDVYDGMFIPAGSTVIANLYGLTRDPEVFPEPEEFRPERFIDNDDPFFKNYSMTFGFGRRICPGQHVAMDQIFLLAARILWAFDITLKNPQPESISQSGRFGSPHLLSYKLVPRREHTASIIMEEALAAEREAHVWDS